MTLSTAYFPPIEYFALLARYSVVYMEAFEHYQKQSWRNRCRILSANGPLDLSFPVVHSGLREQPITGVLVDYSTPWVPKTEKAIESAYSSSPFFDYYRDPIWEILDSEPATLWDLNMRIITFFCSKLGIQVQILPTLEFCGDAVDIHPKRPNSILQDLGLGRPYYQVFGPRFGFTPGLSIMDLLFNEGPESIALLR